MSLQIDIDIECNECMENIEWDNREEVYCSGCWVLLTEKCKVLEEENESLKDQIGSLESELASLQGG